MNKSERAALQRILNDLNRGLAFMDQPNVFLAMKASHSGAMAFSRVVTEGQFEHCMRPDDPLAYAGEQSIAVVDKHIGSHFAGIRAARRALNEFLNPEPSF